MITITKNISGIFVSTNRNNDIDKFSSEYREIIPGFIGINFNGNEDELDFNFNESVITESDAKNQLTNILNTYLTTSLNSLKREIKDLINIERDARLYAFFPYAGARFDCNNESRSNIIGTVVMGILNGQQLPPGMVWRDYDNVNHPMDFLYMVNMGLTMFMYSQQVYASSWQHKYNVDQLTNATQVVNYDYLNNTWPDRGV